MKEPASFLKIGAVVVNTSAYLRESATELRALEPQGDKDKGNTKGFKKARKTPNKMEAFADKLEAIHKDMQKEAEALGYDIQTGDDFFKGCESEGIQLRSDGRRG